MKSGIAVIEARLLPTLLPPLSPVRTNSGLLLPSFYPDQSIILYVCIIVSRVVYVYAKLVLAYLLYACLWCRVY